MAAKSRQRCPKVNKKRPRTKRPPLNRFGRFLRDQGIKPQELADVTGVSRQHILRLRYGTMEPTRPIMIWLTVGCRRLLGKRSRVRITQLFDLGDGEK
jgi:transcriptional regulator with XRE-family HTH domain